MAINDFKLAGNNDVKDFNSLIKRIKTLEDNAGTGGGEVAVSYKKIIDVQDEYLLIGEALPSTNENEPTWRISKVDLPTTSDTISIFWANKSSSFDKIWDNRNLYTYS